MSSDIQNEGKFKLLITFMTSPSLKMVAFWLVEGVHPLVQTVFLYTKYWKTAVHSTQLSPRMVKCWPRWQGLLTA